MITVVMRTKKTALDQKRNVKSVEVRPACSLAAGGSQSIKRACAAVSAATMTPMMTSGRVCLLLYTGGTLLPGGGRDARDQATERPRLGGRLSLIPLRDFTDFSAHHPAGATRTNLVVAITPHTANSSPPMMSGDEMPTT